jgi:hypothetical protein
MEAVLAARRQGHETHTGHCRKRVVVRVERLRDENIVSMDEGGTNLFWADRFGHSLGLDELWGSSAATRTPGRSRTWG